MDNVAHLGLDVHKDTIAVALLRPGAADPDQRIIPNTPEALRKLVRATRPQELVACYEAGPTGYDTYRLLSSLGIPCDVVAPALIPRRPGQRVKTDRLDARNLARLHRAGELTPIRVPSPEEEAVRDLVRCREDIKDDRRRARQKVRSFLLAHGKIYPKSGWTLAFEAWAKSQRFEEAAMAVAFSHLLAASEIRARELEVLNDELENLAQTPGLAGPVGKLRCFRGIDTLSALTIHSEVCDFGRFPSAESFMSFTGLVPSEHSSGATSCRGAITKTGNRHLRRVLVEAAWAYRHHPAVGEGLKRRSQDQPPEVLAYCWAAQLRLHARYRHLAPRKGSRKAVVAVARELSGFVWGLMNERY